MNPDSLPLRDIHLPPEIGWWPLALGWWLLLGLLLVAVGLWLWWRHRLPRQDDNVLEEALQTLDSLPRRYPANSKALLRELNVLLRRVAISRYGRKQVAGLVGAAWVAFLDERAGRTLFGGKLAPLLTASPYQPEDQTETQQLQHAIRLWIELQREGGNRV